MSSNDAAKPQKGENEVAAGILPDRARPNAPTVEKAVLAATSFSPFWGLAASLEDICYN